MKSLANANLSSSHVFAIHKLANNKARRYVLGVAILIILASIPSSAQNTGTGTPPFGSFTGGTPYDVINNQNLNVHLAIDLEGLSSRASTFSFSAINDSQIWKPVNSAWSPVMDATGSPTWGWFIGNPNGSLSRSLVTNGTCLPDNSNAIMRYTESNFVFTDPQGTQHAFPSVSQSQDCVNGQIVISGTTSGYANDASGFFLNARAGSLDGSNIPVGVVTAPNGMQYQNLATTSSFGQHLVMDSNGNFVTIGNVTTFGQTTDIYWFNTSGTSLIEVKSTATPPSLTFDDVNGNSLAAVGYQSVPIATNFGCAGIAEYSGTANLVTAISFANGQIFNFTYEPTPGNPSAFTGRLKTITMSTGGSGGTYQYDYTGANDGVNCSDGTTLRLTRTINDGTTSRVWNFSRSGNITTVTAPKLSYDAVANDTTHTFDVNCHETSTKVFQGSSVSGTLLRTTNKTWATNATPASVVTILEDGNTKAETDTTFDSNGILQAVSEYDFGNPSHGPLLRSTTFTYVTDPNYIGGTNPLNIINLISEIKVQDASGTVQRRTRFNYDEPGTLTSCPLNAPEHFDGAYGCGFQFRGNLTSVLSYKDPVTPANPIITNLTYDFFGNILTKSVAGVQQIQNIFSSTTQYSFPDTVTAGPAAGPQLTTTYTYSLQGEVSTVRDANGQQTGYSYDTLGRPTVVTLPDATHLTTAYDDPNHKVTATTPVDSSHSTVQVQASDPLGNLLTTTVQDGSSNIFSIVKNQYDELGRLYQVSNPYTGTSPAFFTATQFDGLGRTTLTKLPDGQQTTYSYSLQTVTLTDPTGKQVRNKYDALGRLVEVDVPGGNSAPATPGSGSGTVNGNELSAGGVAGAPGTGSVTINGSERHKFTNPCAPAHQNCPVTYYDSGNISLTANGHTDQVTWGGASETALTVAQRLADAIRANSPYVDYTSVVSNSSTSATINLTARTVGVSTDYSISAVSNDTFTSQFPTGVSFAPTTSGPALTNGVNPVAPTYDSGNVWITVNGFRAQVPYQQGSTSGALASTLVSLFNTPGSGSPVNASLSGSTVNLTANSPGSTTNYSLSTGSTSNLPGTFPTPSFSIGASGGTLAGGTDAGGASMATPVATTYAFNVANQITGVNTGTQSRTYIYDALGRRTSASTPELAGQAVAMQYNDLSLLIQSTDVRGVITTYTYDTLNRPASLSYNVGSTGVPATPSISYTYGTSATNLNNGKLLTMTDGSGSETYTYDTMGRKTRCDKVVNGVTYTTLYQYNLAGEVTQVQYPSGRQVNPAYDGIGRLAVVSDTLNSVNTTYASGFTYNVAQQITQFTYGNGVLASFGYSSDGRQQLTSLQYIKGAQTLFGLNYLYTQNGGNNGQITQAVDVLDNGRSATYLYDALGRLGQAYTAGSAAFPNWDIAFSYDQYGNRTDETPQADTSPNATVPSNHILFGSSPQTNRITSGVYAYDANGNMTNDGVNTLVYNAANQIVSSNAGAASYQYDGYGLRVRKCGANCSTSSTVYVYSGGRVIAEYDNGAVPTAPSREYIYAGGRLAKIEGGALQYYHPDHLSIRALSDASGNKIGERGHFPYGEQWYTSGSTTKFSFTSYERDFAETGNDYAVARYYVNRLGRFSSVDPLNSSPNGFAYVMNDPINQTDSSGMVCDDDCVFNHIAAFFGPHAQCTINGIDAPCSLATGLVDGGAADQCPNNDCSYRWTGGKFVFPLQQINGQTYQWHPGLLPYQDTGFWITDDQGNNRWVEGLSFAGWWEPVSDVHWGYGNTFDYKGVPMTGGARSPEEQKKFLASSLPVCDQIYNEYVAAINDQAWVNVRDSAAWAAGGCVGGAAGGFKGCTLGAAGGALANDLYMANHNWNRDSISKEYAERLQAAGCYSWNGKSWDVNF